MNHARYFLSFSLSLVLFFSRSYRAGATATYQIIKDYSGSTFFDDWNYYGNYDNLTNGDAIFVSKDQSSGLTYVDSTSNHAIIKVDNTSTVPYNEKRNTVRISTKDTYGIGTLWVADIYHLPYGCSVWPSWWSTAVDESQWPIGGEMDIIEGVNLGTTNQMALHTTPGCTQVNPVQTSTQITSTNCTSSALNDQGCVTVDPSPQAFGAAFAAAGGGVWVTELAETGVSIWFFSRSNVPSGITSNASSIDTSTLGTPTANYPAGGCPTSKYFSDQILIFDITLCGDWAGQADIFSQTCSGVCYNDYVMGNGSNYANAYFEVGSVRIFSSNPQNTSTSSSGGSSSGSSSSSSNNNSSGSGTSKSGNGSAVSAPFSMDAIAWSLFTAFVAMFLGFL